MLALLIALAAAHHPGGVSRVSNDTAEFMGVPVAEGQWQLDLGLGLALTPFDHVQRGGKRAESVDGVALFTQTPTARLWLPTATFVQVSTPFTAVFTSDEDTFGIGDVAATVGQQVAVGSGALTVSIGASAPTGLASDKAGVDVLFLETEDGELYASSVQTRTQPGLGVWSVSGGVGIAQSAGRWRLRAAVHTRVPVGRTEQGLHWGTDAVVSTSVSTAVSAWSFGAGVEGWTHTPDRMPPIVGLEVYRMNRSHGVAVSPAVSVSMSRRSRCGGAVQLPLWQWVDGSQLAPSYRVSAQCQASIGKRAE